MHAQIVPHKGPMELIEAAKLVVDEANHSSLVKFIFAGPHSAASYLYTIKARIKDVSG